MTAYIVGGVVLFLFLFLVFKKKGDVVPPDDAKKMVKEGALLLDVRTKGEFRAGHLDGAKNIPVNELIRRQSELGKKSNPIVLYCRSGSRSVGAARMLRNAGFEQVFDFGGMYRW